MSAVRPCDRVAPARTAPGVTTRVLTPRRRSSRPGRLVHELERVGAEAGAELGAAGVRLGGHLDHRLADGKPRAGGKVLDAEVEVDEELVARERPAVAATGDQVGGAGVHQRELRIGVGRAVRGAAAPARCHTSPTRPSSRSSTPSSSTSRSSSAGRLTISSTVPCCRRRQDDLVEAGCELVCAAMLHARKSTQTPHPGRRALKPVTACHRARIWLLRFSWVSSARPSASSSGGR